jgi:tetratricopeptide (TPR) repeat protein
VYFSGHGQLLRGEGYLVTYEAVRSDIPNTAYPLSDLRRALAAIQARTKVVFTDACRSGALNNTASTEELRQRLSGLAGGTISFAASGASQAALEPGGAEDRHTIFGQSVIGGLQGYADADCDGTVTAEELSGYVKVQVGRASGGKQEPSIVLPRELSKLALMKYGGARCIGTSPADRKTDLRIELENFSCDDSAAVVQVNGRVAGTICGGNTLRVPGVPVGRYKVRITRAGMRPGESEFTASRPEHRETMKLTPRPRSEAVSRNLERAFNLYTRGGATHYREAVGLLEKVRNEDASDPELAYGIGLVHKVEGHPEKARAALEAAITLDASHLRARALLADLIAADSPGDAIRLLIEVQDLTLEDLRSRVALSRAYQRAQLCEESVQWAKAASRRAPAHIELQAEPLVEHGVSLKICAEQAEESIRTKLDEDAVAAFYEALQRLGRFRSGAGGKLWYELGGAFALGWKFEVARKEQHESLLVDTYAGLCEVELRRENSCAAIAACEKWTSMREKDAEARYRMAFSAATAAHANSACGKRLWTWRDACAAYQKVPVQNLPPDWAKKTRDLGGVIRRFTRCSDPN